MIAAGSCMQALSGWAYKLPAQSDDGEPADLPAEVRKYAFDKTLQQLQSRAYRSFH